MRTICAGHCSIVTDDGNHSETLEYDRSSEGRYTDLDAVEVGGLFAIPECQLYNEKKRKVEQETLERIVPTKRAKVKFNQLNNAMHAMNCLVIA